MSQFLSRGSPVAVPISRTPLMDVRSGLLEAEARSKLEQGLTWDSFKTAPSFEQLGTGSAV